MCSVLEVSRAGFYCWSKRASSKRERENQQLLVQIKAIHSRSRHTYGSPRIHDELKDSSISVGLNRVARLMRENDVAVLPRKGFRVSTTKADPLNAVAENKLDRNFSAIKPNEKWVTDVTFVPTDEGWLYLAAMLDLYNREVVGWAMSKNNDAQLTLNALEMALEAHKPPKGLLHHSDRGSTYTCKEYRKRLTQYGIACSMSRKGDCWDNAVSESFFATIKKELIHRFKFETRRLAASAIFEYIEVFYNRIRKHSKPEYTSPAEYRRKYFNQLASA